MGTMLQLHIFNEGRRATVQYVSAMCGGEPPDPATRAISRWTGKPTPGFGVMLAGPNLNKWLEPGEAYTVQTTLENLTSSVYGILRQTADPRPASTVLRKLYVQLQCGEGHEHMVRLDANAKSELKRWADHVDRLEAALPVVPDRAQP